jgi:hypothetical protein
MLQISLRFLITPLPGGVSKKKLRLRLPDDVHCTQCVLRWYWKGGMSL